MGFTMIKKLGLVATPEPGSFPELPFHLHAHPESKSLLRLGEANLFSPGMKRLDLSSNCREPSVREKLWQKLSSYF